MEFHYFITLALLAAVPRLLLGPVLRQGQDTAMEPRAEAPNVRFLEEKVQKDEIHLPKCSQNHRTV